MFKPSPKATLPPRAVPAYQKPAVKDLGDWQAVTLIYSLPIGPGKSGLPENPQRF